MLSEKPEKRMSQPLKIFVIKSTTVAACVPLQHRTSCWYDIVVSNNCKQPAGKNPDAEGNNVN